MQKILTIIIILCLSTANALAKVPKVEEVVSKTGYKAWMIEDSYLPIVSIKLAFTKSGTAYDPVDKIGLAYMVSGLLDEGAGGMSSFDYRKKLEELATSISFDSDDDNFYVTVKCLTKNLEQSLELLNLTLTQPNFKPDVIERIRNQILVIIAKKQESPKYIAARKFSETVFGDHPYSRPEHGSAESIKAISRDDLLSYVTNNLTRQNIIISIAGDISKTAASDMLDKHLKLPANRKAVADLPEVNLTTDSGVIHVEKNIPQSVVVFGAPGIKRNDENFYPAYLMNHILGGGGFESRLMDEVREKNGLAYTVYSYLNTSQKNGLIAGYVGTDNAKVDKSIEIIKKEISKMHDNGVTEQELQDTKDYLVNSFPLKMTKNSNLAAFLSGMQIDDLGMDFFEKRNSYVANVTTEQIKAMSQQLLDVNKMTFVVVGGKE